MTPSLTDAASAWHCTAPTIPPCLNLWRSDDASIRGAGEAEAVVVVPARGGPVVAGGGAAVGCAATPAAAALNAAGTPPGADGVGARLRVERAAPLVPVQAPFPNVAVHVVESPGVGLVGADYLMGVCLALLILFFDLKKNLK